MFQRIDVVALAALFTLSMFSVGLASDLPKVAPGERVISIDGKPVTSSQPGLVCENGNCRIAQPSAGAAGLMPYEVNRDARAYAHAKREAQILASQRRVYHPLRPAPGCSRSGTGNSMNGRPNHCFLNAPQSQIVARACARGSDGKLYWSCHLR